MITRSSESRTLLTPQGDGNEKEASLLAKDVSECPAPSLPRKGTETHGASPEEAKALALGPAPSLPRKGTETHDR